VEGDLTFDLRAHTHLLVVAGSRAFGIHTDASDVDVKGVAIPPASVLHGLGTFEQATEVSAFAADLTAEERAIAERTHLEGTVFDLRKFLRLLSEANPNLLDVLFCRDEEIRVATPIGGRLRERRNLFVTARCRHTFGGYATAQLKRIETHRKWLLEPPERAPTRDEYDLPERTIIPADQLAAAWAAIRARVDSWDVDLSALEEPERLDLRGRIADMLAEMQLFDDARWRAGARAVGLDENFILLLDRERRYKAAKTQWDQYTHWKATRNAARAATEAEFGYDVKHGAHLYRLLKMCREILTTGEVHVWRGGIDSDEIRAIRRGEWPYDRLVGWAKEQDAELTGIYEKKAYVVPDAPDRAAIDALCVELVEAALANRP
jgi:hypothetical protein